MASRLPFGRQPVLGVRRAARDELPLDDPRGLELLQPFRERRRRDPGQRLAELVEARRRWRRHRSCPASSGAPAAPPRSGARRGPASSYDTAATSAPCPAGSRAQARGPRRCSSPGGRSSARAPPRGRRRGRRGCAPAGSPRSARRRGPPGPSASRPPIGSTRPCRVTSPVIPTVCFTGRPLSSDASAVVIAVPALGPSLGIAPGRDVHVELALEAAAVDAELVGVGAARRRARSAPTPSSRRPAGRSAPGPCRPPSRSPR